METLTRAAIVVRFFSVSVFEPATEKTSCVCGAMNARETTRSILVDRAACRGADRADDGAGRDRRDRLFAHGAELEAGGGERGDCLVEAHADERRDGAELLAVRASVSGCVELHEREDAAVAGRERSHLRLVLASGRRCGSARR